MIEKWHTSKGEKKDYIIHTDDGIFEQRKFILIPHPSYAHINWNRHDIKSKIESALQN